ncbi:hypothetical protein L873DRAFT_1774165, partial [Choiromyces venosus 120613-1]
MTTGTGLSDAYTITVAQTKAQSRNLTQTWTGGSMWISNAERSKQADELCHVFGVNIGYTHLDLGKVPAIQTLLGCTLGVLTFGETSSTVRLVHYTLQEYL